MFVTSKVVESDFQRPRMDSCLFVQNLDQGFGQLSQSRSNLILKAGKQMPLLILSSWYRLYWFRHTVYSLFETLGLFLDFAYAQQLYI
jgi:hypothetical protein